MYIVVHFINYCCELWCRSRRVPLDAAPLSEKAASDVEVPNDAVISWEVDPETLMIAPAASQ